MNLGVIPKDGVPTRAFADKKSHGDNISVENNNMKTDAQLNFEYATTTSCHGWAKVARAKGTWEKVGWVIIVLACVGFLLGQTVFLLKEYLAFSLVTTVDLQVGT